MVDDNESAPRQPTEFPRNLDRMEIQALEDYIVELNEEISRVRENIAAKNSMLGDAESLFKS